MLQNSGAVTGRIKSQRNQTSESRLLKQYDGYDHERIRNLRDKYNSNHETQKPLRTQFQQQRIPLTSILNIQQNGSSNRIRSNLRNFISKVKNETLNQKLDQQDNFKIQGNLNQFRSQVGVINTGIGNRLDEIEDKIRQYREKKQRDRQLENLKEKFKQQDKERQQKQAQRIKQIESQRAIYTINAHQFQSQDTPFKAIQFQSQITEPVKNDYMIQQSCIALKGQKQSGKQFTRQFTLFINRVKDQIKVDRQLTQLLLTLRPNILKQVQLYINKYHPRADLSYFQISPIEIDPLKTPIYLQISTHQQIKQIGEKCYKLYQGIKEQFEIKLKRKYEKETIDMLFEQLGSDQISMGHIVSYINMRTQQQFRNRDLVKLLRRINVFSHYVDKMAFYKNFTISL